MTVPARILIVDDEDSIRISLKGFLEDQDFDVTVCASAEKALALIADTGYDMVIVDLRLPGQSGESLISEAHRLQPALRFLIHTGSVSYHLSDELRRIGLKKEDVFFKPVADLHLISDAIGSLLKGN